MNLHVHSLQTKCPDFKSTVADGYDIVIWMGISMYFATSISLLHKNIFQLYNISVKYSRVKDQSNEKIKTKNGCCKKLGHAQLKLDNTRLYTGYQSVSTSGCELFVENYTEMKKKAEKKGLDKKN